MGSGGGGGSMAELPSSLEAVCMVGALLGIFLYAHC
jgi:hypothetical protein